MCLLVLRTYNRLLGWRFVDAIRARPNVETQIGFLVESRLVPHRLTRYRVLGACDEMLVVLANAVANRPPRTRLVLALVDVELDAYGLRFVDSQPRAEQPNCCFAQLHVVGGEQLC